MSRAFSNLFELVDRKYIDQCWRTNCACSSPLLLQLDHICCRIKTRIHYTTLAQILLPRIIVCIFELIDLTENHAEATDSCFCVFSVHASIQSEDIKHGLYFELIVVQIL